MQITQLNEITEIPFDFSQKYQTVPRPNRRDFCRLPILQKKNLNVGPANRPAFCRQVPLFFTRNVPLKHSPGWQVCVPIPKQFVRVILTYFSKSEK